MKLSERIGYCLEHLLALELGDRGITVVRSERRDDATIKSDLSFTAQRGQYVVFVTHTRTQGMTNRKFYRTFEELSQRRIANPAAICAEVSLTRSPNAVPTQYGLIFHELFDCTLSVIPPRSQDRFVEFVKSIGSPFDIDATDAARPQLPQAIRRHIITAIDTLLRVKRQKHKSLAAYWESERRIPAASNRYSPREDGSIKQGMKLLALLGANKLSLSELASGRVESRDGFDLEHLTRVGIIVGERNSIAGRLVIPCPAVQAAARACLRNRVELDGGWWNEYLTSSGAKLLHADLMNPGATAKRLATLDGQLRRVRNAQQLFDMLWEEYTSPTERCELFDLALRASGLSQNQASLLVLSETGTNIAQRNPVWFVVAKDENCEQVIEDVRGFVKACAHVIWSKCGGSFAAVEWQDFYAARLATFLAHRSVVPQLALLTQDKPAARKRTRQSILPRLLNLPPQYRMSVTATRCWEGVFMVDVSTPDPQHHKHKEFAGKLRAIRYDMHTLQRGVIRFVFVADGNWSDGQLRTLCQAGWEVYDWDTFLESEAPDRVVVSNDK